MTTPARGLCPFLSVTGPSPCVGDACQLWMTQWREHEDGRRDDFSNCVFVVAAVTQARALTEQIRTTATVDGAKEALMMAPRVLMSAMVRQRVIP